MRSSLRRRLAGLSVLAWTAFGTPLAADEPQMAASVPIERVVGVVRCNLGEARAATAKAHMRLTVTAVDLHLSALQNESGKAATVEVPAIAAGADLHVLAASEDGGAGPVSTHAVDVHFVPFAENASGPACQADIGLLSVVQSAIAALSASEAGTDRLAVDLTADFLISRSQDDKIGFVFVDREHQLGHLAVHSFKIELQLDRT